MSVTSRVYVYQDRCPEGTSKLAEALAKAIPNMQPLVRNCISHYAKKGPDGKPQPDYADLAACHKSAARALAEQGLVVIQTVALVDNGETILNTQLMHASGQWISSVLPIKAPSSDPQKMAAAITYARRTAYCAIVGLAADDDDDGAQAQVAAGKSNMEEEARVEKLLMKRLEAARTPEEREEVVNTARRGLTTGHLSPESVARVELAARSSPKKEAAAPPPAKAAPAPAEKQDAPAPEAKKDAAEAPTARKDPPQAPEGKRPSAPTAQPKKEAVS